MPTKSEFDGAFLRLLERYGRLCWDDLTEQELDHLSLLAEDSAELKRWDQTVLRDWACNKGVCMCDVYRQPNAPIVYMARLLHSYGYTSLEEVAEDFVALRRGC